MSNQEHRPTIVSLTERRSQEIEQEHSAMDVAREFAAINDRLMELENDIFGMFCDGKLDQVCLAQLRSFLEDLEDVDRGFREYCEAERGLNGKGSQPRSGPQPVDSRQEGVRRVDSLRRGLEHFDAALVALDERKLLDQVDVPRIKGLSDYLEQLQRKLGTYCWHRSMSDQEDPGPGGRS